MGTRHIASKPKWRGKKEGGGGDVSFGTFNNVVFLSHT